LGGEPLLTNQKYSKNHITIQGLMGLILSNYLFFEKDTSTNQALLERLHIIEFLYNVDKELNNMDTNNINQLLTNEEPNIIIFCNKLYFSYYNNKPIYNNKYKKLKSTIQNKNTISLNNKLKKTFFVKYSETSM
jgi:glycine/serine hydroxymethyltransferase